ncbi:hypothetical protein ACIOHE_30495 [Streptomyces sp. NPDC087851]|uniref:hypothetical protein n=1 Tax=Streptomyces sp. NPDC087851 TaxID=3365810 RepID=UPI0037F124C0
MATTEDQISQLRRDLTAADAQLSTRIQEKLDKDKFSFLEEKKKGAKKSEEETYEKRLKNYVDNAIEEAGKSTWVPDIREFKTPEFMALVTAITGTMIGVTFIKYDFTILDLTEKINRLILDRVNRIARRHTAERRFRTAEQKAERALNLRFSTLDNRIATLRRNVNRRIDLVERRLAATNTSHSNVRNQVTTGVPRSPGSIPQAHDTARELNSLHTRIDALVAALG